MQLIILEKHCVKEQHGKIAVYTLEVEYHTQIAQA
jgi:hypothetical protein